MLTISLDSKGCPTTAGKHDLGVSSPENPALIIPDPLSMTIAG